MIKKIHDMKHETMLKTKLTPDKTAPINDEQRKSILQKIVIPRFPDYGSCEIENWKEFLPKSKTQFYENWYSNTTIFPHKETLNDFDQMSLLGSGSFGSVILVRHKTNGKYFAMKAIGKERIIKYKQLEHIKTEKKILQCLNFPLTVYLVYFFKDNSFIYLVMPFIPGGELFTHLRKSYKFDEVQAMFYGSQVVLALEYLHYLDLVYRDLKPENILVDHYGYLKLADFGFCKRLVKERTYTLCGTPEYLAPEVILSKGYGKAVDWWGVGVLLYEMVAGTSPFCASSDIKIYEKIVSCNYKFSPYFSNDLKDLVNNILQVNVSKRFGNLKDGAGDIKNHNWFKPINWMAILNRKVTPPWKPRYSDPGYMGNFDLHDWIPPKISEVDTYVSEFEDF